MTNKIKNITIIGSGNVATHLALNLKNKGFNISQIYSRNIENAKILAKKVQAQEISNIKELNSSSDLYIISVSDSAIKEIISKINIANKIIVHTSGSISIDIFANKFENFGVFYPLQTFSKSKSIDLSKIPFLIEANNTKTLSIIKEIVHSLSNTVKKTTSEERKSIHIAAIFANNFTNHFCAIAQEYMQENNLDFNLLKPLILETANKIIENNPLDIQTGPAKRNDIITIENHLEMLKNKPEFQKLYSFVSESILNLHKKNK